MREYRVCYFHAKTPTKGLTGRGFRSLREAKAEAKDWLTRGARRAIIEVREVGPWVGLDEKRRRIGRAAMAELTRRPASTWLTRS